MVGTNLLAEEIRTYEKTKPELLKSSLGKFVLIKGSKVIKIFETQQDAIKEGISLFGNTPFLVKKIELVEQTQNFTSNLIRCCAICHQ